MDKDAPGPVPSVSQGERRQRTVEPHDVEALTALGITLLQLSIRVQQLVGATALLALSDETCKD